MRVDDYFELGPVTQVAGRMPSVMVTQLRKNSPRATFIPQQDTSEGILRPVVLIGLGQFGRATLQWIRQGLQLQFGPMGLPVVRLLAVDTDPSPPSDHLARVNENEDLFVARLNRPARYIRSRDTLPPVEDWLSSNILYRMPRTQLTSGIRALGRLALVEHYRAFRSRLERDLKAILETEAMAEAEKLVKAPFISTKPRVYLITHLGGGTGSGMLFDAAYIAKKQLRTMGMDDNEVHAICYVPNQECMENADLPEANAVAALYEMHHFQQASSPFRALYESKSEWTEEETPPFTQIQLIETPPRPAVTKESKDKAILQIQKVAEVVNRLITSPLGRVADPVKLTAGATPYQAMGMRVLNSPRRALVRRACHLICQRLLDQWLAPSTVENQDVARHRIDGFFHYEKLSPESLYKLFEHATQSSLGQEPDAAIQKITAPFQQGIQAKMPESEDVKKALRDIVTRLGPPPGGSSTNTLVLADDNTKLNRALKDASDKILRSGATRLVFTIFRHLDKPGLRVGATEEALRYSLTKLDGWIGVHESKAKQSQLEYAQALEYLRQDLAEYEKVKGTPKRRWPGMITPGERLLSIYRARFRSLIHEQIAKVYVGFRGACSDQNRDIRFCRTRLQELQQSVLTMEKLPERPVTTNRVTESVIIPHGCKDLLQAVEQFAQSITPSDLEKIDQVVSQRMQQHYPRLAELCLSSFDQLRPIRDLIMQESKFFLEQRLTIDDAAGLFLANQKDPKEAFVKVYEEATPMLQLINEQDSREAAFLMVNDSVPGKKMGEVACQIYPHTRVIDIKRNDEVMLFRTIVGITLENLPVLGENGIQAYQTAMGIEHFTPHARQDIDQWRNPAPLVSTPH